MPPPSPTGTPTAPPDVLVVGGGAVGLCAAYYLAEAGRRVTVLAREAPGEGASAGNAGMLVPSHIVPLAAPGVVAQGLKWMASRSSPFHVRLRADRALARWLWTFVRHGTEAHVRRAVPVLRDLSLASVALFADLHERLGDAGFARTGLLMVHHTPKGAQANAALARRARGAGLDVEELDAAALRAAEPALRTPAAGAVLFRQDGRIDPDAFLARLAGHLRARGVAIERVEVRALERRGGRVVGVWTSGGPRRAAAVVLAAGAWTPGLAATAGVRVPVQPARGYSITVPTPAGAPRLPMILVEEKLTVTPLPGRLRFAGTLVLAGFDPSVDARRAAPLRALAAAYAGPDAARAPVWSGYRPCSPDGLPIVGRVPGVEGLVLATGHGMMGVTLAPVTGRLVARLLDGAPTDLDATPLHPARFA